MQQTFDKTRCGTTIFINIETFTINFFWLDDIFWNADSFILMRLNGFLSTTDASFDIVTDKRLLSTCVYSLKVTLLAAELSSAWK